MDYVLILGAKSDIAKSIAKVYAEKGYPLVLASRLHESLIDFSSQLQQDFSAAIILKEFDVLKTNEHQNFINNLNVPLAGVVCCVGYLGNQKLAESDVKERDLILNTNFTGPVNILSEIANKFKTNNKGFIVGISSVAGERGRQSNFFYGSAKAGFTEFLSGLRNSLSKTNIHVLTVKPGFVYTQMTQDLDLPKTLTATPDLVAKKVFQAQQRGKNTLYVKWFWKYIMLVIKLIPEPIFKKMNL